MVRTLLTAVLAEPAVENPPSRLRRDWWLAAVLCALVVFEGIVGEQQTWRPAATALGVGLCIITLWRRQYPLATMATAFGTVAVLGQAMRIVTGESLEYYSLAVLLLLPYALFRWGSGRHCAIGTVVMVAMIALGLSTDWSGIGDAIGGAIVLSMPAVLGVEIRHFVGSRERRVDDARATERTLLARELHDTVAHHVSAIAVRAQAGQVLGATDPSASLDALAVIEAEASRTLDEMRGIVGALRGHDDAEYSPLAGVTEIEELATLSERPTVRVDIDRTPDDVGAALGTALYRIAQESVTNARRHAHRASEIVVTLCVDSDQARLVVDDDGQRAGHDIAQSAGFGLIGMRERVDLLGGTLSAGPMATRGWRVDATIPVRGPR